MINFLNNWQTLIGSIIGASSPFFLWWIVDGVQRRRRYYDDICYLERVLVDQINGIVDLERTVRSFSDHRLSWLIENIKANDSDAYSIDHTFFPLFSISVLSDRIHEISTKSGYIDNKVAKSRQLSKDIPRMMEDLRHQFNSTIEINRDLSLNKVNPPNLQKEGYIQNVEEFKKMLDRDMLNKNFPVCLKVFVQAREAVLVMKKIYPIMWRLKFDPRYKYYRNKKQYLEAKENSFDNIEKYFEEVVKKTLESIKSKK